MKTSVLLLGGAFFLSVAGKSGAGADSSSWLWRFRPAPQSRWKVAVFERVQSTSAQDMVSFHADNKGHETQRRVPTQMTDQASHRAEFDVDVLARDANGCQLRWTFRRMEALRERDGFAEWQPNIEMMSPAARAEEQKTRRHQAQRKRNEEALAGQRFTRSLAGASFSCAVAADGRVTRFGDWNDWQKRVAAATLLAKDDGFLQIAFRPLLIPNEMKDWVQGWLTGLPNAPVEEGQSWQFAAKVADLDFLTPLSTVTRTLQSHDAGRALVNEAASFAIAPPTPKLAPNSVAYTFSAQGARQSRLQVDAQNGMMRRTSRRLAWSGHRGVIDDRGRVLQDEALTFRVTSEIAAQPR